MKLGRLNKPHSPISMYGTQGLVKDWSQEEKGGNRRCDGWMASPTQWTWVWENSGRWWWTGRPGVLKSMGHKESDTTDQLNKTKMQQGSSSSWTEHSGPLTETTASRFSLYFQARLLMVWVAFSIHWSTGLNNCPPPPSPTPGAIHKMLPDTRCAHKLSATSLGSQQHGHCRRGRGWSPPQQRVLQTPTLGGPYAHGISTRDAGGCYSIGKPRWVLSLSHDLLYNLYAFNLQGRP